MESWGMSWLEQNVQTNHLEIKDGKCSKHQGTLCDVIKPNELKLKETCWRHHKKLPYGSRYGHFSAAQNNKIQRKLNAIDISKNIWEFRLILLDHITL